MEHKAITDLLRRDKIAIATRCLGEQDVTLEAAVICQHTEFARGLMRIAQRGGIGAAKMLINRVAWKSSEPDEVTIPLALSSALFDAAYDAACHPQKGQRKHLVDLVALLLALPYADDARLGRLMGLYRKYLASALVFQTEVCERNGMRDLREALRLSSTEEIRRCIGSTVPFSILKDILLVAALCDAYPTIATSMLRETMLVAEWPIIACLGPGITVIMWPTLHAWFLHPVERIMFTAAAKDWLKHAVCGDSDDYDEPEGSFPDD